VKNAIRFCLVLAGTILVGCEREPAQEATELPADTIAGGTAGTDTTADEKTISLADIAGTWSMRYVPASGDTSAVTSSEIRVTPESWTLHLPGRDSVEGVVTASGDSLIVLEGPYESVRRDGIMVTTESVYRLEGDRLVGTVVARYPSSRADSVLVLSSEGTRAP
jgi:hypothetical protein